MNCPSCAQPNRPQARFCSQCGHPLTGESLPPQTPTASHPVCPACGVPVRPQARYCPGCGEPLPAGPASEGPAPLSPSQIPTQLSTLRAAQHAGTGSAPIFSARLDVVASGTELRAGERVVVTLTLTNTGQVPFGSLRYQLLGDWEPYLRVASDPVVEHEPDVAPGQSDRVTFTLEAVEPCPVWLQGNVTLQTREEPPALKPVTSTDVIEVTVVHA